MTINTSAIISVSEANQNFSKATRIADANGQAIIFKNNHPKYALIDLDIHSSHFLLSFGSKETVIHPAKH